MSSIKYKKRRIHLLSEGTLMMLAMFFFSCNSEDSRIKKEIIGKWEVYNTELNNIPNGLMQNGWFEFLENGKVASNIFEDTSAYDFQIDERVLKIGGVPSLDLKIARIQRDSLCLEGQLSHYFMRYYLVKKKDSQ